MPKHRGYPTVLGRLLLVGFYGLLVSPWPARGATEGLAVALHSRRARIERTGARRAGPPRRRRRGALSRHLPPAGRRRPRGRRSPDRRARRSAPARSRALAALPAPDRPSLDLRRARGLARAVCRPPGRRPDLSSGAAPPAGRRRPAGAAAAAAISRAAARSRRSRHGPVTAASSRARARTRPWCAPGARRSNGWSRTVGRTWPRPRRSAPEIVALTDPVELDLARWTVARGYLGAGEHAKALALAGRAAARSGRSRPGDPLDRRDQRLAPGQDPARGVAFLDARERGFELARGTLPRGLLGCARLCRHVQAAARPALPAARRRLARFLWPAGADRARRGAGPREGPDRPRRRCGRSPAGLARRPARAGARPGRRGRARRAGDPQACRPRLGRADGRADRARATPRSAGRADASGPEPRRARGRLPLRRPLPGADLAAGQRLFGRPGAGLRDHARRVRLRPRRRKPCRRPGVDAGHAGDRALSRRPQGPRAAAPARAARAGDLDPVRPSLSRAPLAVVADRRQSDLPRGRLQCRAGARRALARADRHRRRSAAVPGVDPAARDAGLRQEGADQLVELSRPVRPSPGTRSRRWRATSGRSTARSTASARSMPGIDQRAAVPAAQHRAAHGLRQPHAGRGPLGRPVGGAPGQGRAPARRPGAGGR